MEAGSEEGGRRRGRAIAGLVRRMIGAADENDAVFVQQVERQNLLQLLEIKQQRTLQQQNRAYQQLVPAALLPAIETRWSNCRGVGSEHQQTGVRCQLKVTLNGQPYSVSRDVFSLACSRSKCSIDFDANQPSKGSSFMFTYSPNYPSTFESEDVGSPGLFPDQAILTDGFSVGLANFGIDYQPGQENVLLETEVVDVMKYKSKQTCCATVRHVVWVENDEDDIF
eukprot:TRINITY_DN2204_c0_g6_i3.p2 TRINITY_DN2204_c0_g6~~TRINITY_DN2204_c0_g6_i3.p2  ORF type:complete len:245 (-),score=61.38 TRINITY_DN2204_c0_g6_i3:70-744(-)